MAFLVRNLKLHHLTTFPSPAFSANILPFRGINDLHSFPCSFRSFGSYTAQSGYENEDSYHNLLSEPCIVWQLEDGMDDHQEFLRWSNGGGLFHKSACIDPSTVVEVGAIIHPRATLCANVHVGSGAVVGPSVTIGHSTRLGYNVALNNCSIGDSCVIHSGVCIGQDGFGFFVNEHGNMTKKPQTLNAIIGNHVEIGANTCVDRGSWRDTTIGDYTKIDNLVQIAHNVVIGKNCILCGQVGIAGSATIGDYVTLGGRVGVRDHVSIASKVRLAANSSVTKDIKEPGDYGGFPAVPIQQWRRQVAAHRWN